MANTLEVWEEFLKNYPDSPRTEAATLQLLRRRTYQLAPVPMPKYTSSRISPVLLIRSRTVAFPPVPGRPSTANPSDRPPVEEDEPDFDTESDPSDPETETVESPSRDAVAERQKALNALAADIRKFRVQFPNSRYLPDLALLEAGVTMETGHFQEGLDQLAAILSDAKHPELTMDAALRLAEFGMRLLDRDQRPEVARAFRASAAILPYLENLSEGDTCLRRLQPLIPWLKSEALPRKQ